MNPMECCGQKDYCIRRREVENACLNCIVPKLYVRVAAYEDTGLMPEEVERSKLEIEAGCVKAIARTYGININRLRKLAEADRDGRVVVLPPESYDWKIRGDLALGIIIANCKAAETKRAMEEKAGKKDG